MSKRFKVFRRAVGFFLFILFLGGGTPACVQRPIEELALADVALKAAQKSKADVLAPDTYRRAENFYLRAKKDYTDGYYDSSRKYSNQARLAAEQAEFQSLRKQNQMQSRSSSGSDSSQEEPMNSPTTTPKGEPP